MSSSLNRNCVSKNSAYISSAMFRAVNSNNEGVRRMRLQLYDDAVASFTNVLETLSPIISENRTHQRLFMTSQASLFATSTPTERIHSAVNAGRTVLASSADKHKCCKLMPPTSISFPKESIEKVSSSQTAKIIHGHEHFIFRDPIEIPFNVVPRTSEPPPEKLLNKFVVVIMYNLALSVHMSAIQSLDTSSLFRAQQLYEIAFQMHLEESCDVTLLYSLALLNNLGLIYDVVGEDVRSKSCFTNMLSTMMYLMETNKAQTIKQWDGLLANVMNHMFKDQEVAAPAA